MSKSALCFVVALAAATVAQPAQAIVGYYNVSVPEGWSLLANQLSSGNDYISNVLTGVPTGSQFRVWDPVTSDFKPTAVFNGSWSIDYSLGAGEAGLLWSPSPVTATFVGELRLYTNIPPGGGATAWEPNYADGLHLISNPEPISGSLSTVFFYVTGRDPVAGEWVGVMTDPVDQTYSKATFDGTSWDTPMSLAVGQGAWFNLGSAQQEIPIASVPEPASLALMVTAGALLALRRRVRSHTNPSPS